MAPIDPIELLKAFRPLLTRNGGIKNSEVPRLAGLMRKFSKKLVSRCIYCNILLATDADVLETFLTNDGWNIVNSWLKDAREDQNDPLLEELLKLLDICPMSVDRLKENDTAKVVKTLSKLENEEIAEKSRAIVNKWMQIIKVGNEQKLIEENAKKKRKKEFERSKSIEESEEAKTKKLKLKIDSPENNDTNSIQAEVDSSTSDSVESAVHSIEKQLCDANIAKPQTANVAKPKENGFTVNASVNNNVKLESRAPTAKIRYGKSRSIGFEGLSSMDSTPKTSKVVAKNIVSPTVYASKDVLLNKTLKAHNNDTVNETNNESKASRVILIDPKPLSANSLNNKVSHTIKESASFMDAMTAVNSERSQTRKKRRLSANSSSASVSKTTDDETADKGDALDEKGEDDDETVTGDEEEANEEEDFPIELTEVEKQIEAELRGKEISETVDYGNDYMDNYEEDQYQPMEPEEEQMNITNNVTSPSQLKSILCYGRRFGQKKKSVKWVSDDKIKQVKFFELDETERCNVSRTFGEYRLLDLKNERQALLSAKRGYPESPEKAPIEHFPWMCILIGFPEDVVVHDRGGQSNEKRVQEERQRGILHEFYPLRELAPDFPQEPDIFEALAGAHEAPVEIPLEDENNPQVIDYSQMELPKPVTGDELPLRSPNQFAPPYGNVLPPVHQGLPLPGMFSHQMPHMAQMQHMPPSFTNSVMPNVGMVPSIPYPTPHHQQPPLQQQQVSYNTYGTTQSSQQSRPPPQYNRRPSFRREERRDRPRNNKVCKFFAKNGRCKFAQCNFLHQSPNSSSHNNDRSNRNSYNDNNNVKQDSKNDNDEWGSSRGDDWSNSVTADISQTTMTTTSSNDGWD